MSAILEKVKKLLALATSSNVHEAAAAAAKAQELIEKHKIDRAELEKKDEPVGGEVLYDFDGPPVQWKLQLAALVAEVNGCAAVLISGRADTDFAGKTAVLASGEREDLDTAKYLASYLILEVERLTDEAAKSHREFSGTWSDVIALDDEAWRTSFQAGATSEICSRLVAAREAARRKERSQAAGRFELVRIERSIERVDQRALVARAFAQEAWVPEGPPVTPKNEASNPWAFMKGMAAGSRVGLAPPDKSIT